MADLGHARAGLQEHTGGQGQDGTALPLLPHKSAGEAAGPAGRARHQEEERLPRPVQIHLHHTARFLSRLHPFTYVHMYII